MDDSEILRNMPPSIKPSAAQQRFASNMRRIRLAKNLTQEKVAEAADLHVNYISSVERAKRNISIRNIERIAIALDVPMSILLMDEHEAPPLATTLQTSNPDKGP